jgi:ABC-type nitrate/sulfonate/bicarbonate transport system ATPase subunit
MRRTFARPPASCIQKSRGLDVPTLAREAATEAPPVAAAAPKAPPLLEMRGITKTFGSVTALQGLDATVAPREFVTVVGPSGCGKSTLFNIVAGLDEPDAGSILRFEGRGCHASELLGRVSFMPQSDLLLPWRNVIDNAILALEVEGVPRKTARAQALRMLPEFGLGGFESQYPHQLSGGMRQRVALMRTFLFRRELMLLDEPFGALDALTRAIMQRWLLDVWQHNLRTILFITHDVDEAIFLGDRVLAMTARPGKVKLELTIDLPRPRPPEIVTSAEFMNLKRTLLEAIEEESMKAFLSNQETHR